MRLFGEFLVENKFVTEEQLLTALMEQKVLLPSLCEIIYKEKLLPTPEILRVLSYQARTQCEFRTACLDLGIWTTELNAKSRDALRRVKIPLGQILVSQGVLTFEVIMRALDDYLSEASLLDTSIPPPKRPETQNNENIASADTASEIPSGGFSQQGVPSAHSSPTHSTISLDLTSISSTIEPQSILPTTEVPEAVPSLQLPQMPSPTLEELLNFIPEENQQSPSNNHPNNEPMEHPIDPMLITDYCDLLTDDKLNEMQNRIQKVLAKNAGTILPETLKDIFEALSENTHELRGTARFIRAYSTLSLADKLDELISVAQRVTLTHDDLTNIQCRLAEATQHMRSLRDSLRESGSESNYASPAQVAIAETMQALENLRVKLTSKIPSHQAVA